MELDLLHKLPQQGSRKPSGPHRNNPFPASAVPCRTRWEEEEEPAEEPVLLPKLLPPQSSLSLSLRGRGSSEQTSLKHSLWNIWRGFKSPTTAPVPKLEHT